MARLFIGTGGVIQPHQTTDLDGMEVSYMWIEIPDEVSVWVLHSHIFDISADMHIPDLFVYSIHGRCRVVSIEHQSTSLICTNGYVFRMRVAHHSHTHAPHSLFCIGFHHGGENFYSREVNRLCTSLGLGWLIGPPSDGHATRLSPKTSFECMATKTR